MRAALLTLLVLPAIITCAIDIPVIGIYTQDAEIDLRLSTGTYIASSYVKYLEMSGAKVVPLFYNSTQESLRTTLQQINGVLFPGGSMIVNASNKFTLNAQFILDFAIQQNQQGKTFPLLGICQGHELLAYLTSHHDPAVLQHVDQELRHINTLQFLDRSGSLFKNWQPSHFEAATTGTGILYFSHEWAVYRQYFENTPFLKNFWKAIAVSTSPVGQEFMSALESKQFPFYTVQFHPEKNPFEWRIDANRTRVGLEAVQVMGNNFLAQARLSANRYSSAETEYKSLIQNYKSEIAPSYTFFNEIYRFVQEDV